MVRFELPSPSERLASESTGDLNLTSRNRTASRKKNQYHFIPSIGKDTPWRLSYFFGKGVPDIYLVAACKRHEHYYSEKGIICYHLKVDLNSLVLTPLPNMVIIIECTDERRKTMFYLSQHEWFHEPHLEWLGGSGTLLRISSDDKMDSTG